jgi:hypothetical protein
MKTANTHRLLFKFLLFSVFFNGVATDTLADTPNGRLKGFTTIVDDKVVRAFLSVPFAEPPTEKWRFMPPRPKLAWNGTKDATILSPACYQVYCRQEFYFLHVALQLENLHRSCVVIQWCQVPIVRNFVFALGSVGLPPSVIIVSQWITAKNVTKILIRKRLFFYERMSYRKG